MKISKKLVGKEIEIGDAKFHLRPFPYDEIKYDRGAVNPIDVEKTMFMYCVESWEGIEDLDTGEVFECNEENKLYLFRYEYALRQELIIQINELMASKLEQVKNLLRSQNGKETAQSSSAPTATKSTRGKAKNPPVTSASDLV